MIVICVGGVLAWGGVMLCVPARLVCWGMVTAMAGNDNSRPR